MTIYFIAVGISFILTRLIYVNYLESIGLDYNPNKAIKIFGQEMKPYYNMFKVIDDYIQKKNLSVGQVRYLRTIRKWEMFNWIALGLFPFVVLLSEFI